MSDRERWTVYPLLFLALGVSLRDKLTRTIDGVAIVAGASTAINLDSGYVRTRVVDADLVRCRKIEVREESTRPLAIIGGVDVPSENGEKKTSGAISVYGQEGKEIIVLRANHALQGEFVKRQKEGEQGEVVFEVKEVKEAGGLLEVFDARKTMSLVLAHHALESGLFAKNSKGQLARLSHMVKRSPTKSDTGPAAPGTEMPEHQGTTGDVPEGDQE